MDRKQAGLAGLAVGLVVGAGGVAVGSQRPADQCFEDQVIGWSADRNDHSVCLNLDDLTGRQASDQRWTVARIVGSPQDGYRLRWADGSYWKVPARSDAMRECEDGTTARDARDCKMVTGEQFFWMGVLARTL